MNFDFSDDQKMLKEQVRKFLADKCPMSVTRRVLEEEEPYAAEVWKGLGRDGPHRHGDGRRVRRPRPRLSRTCRDRRGARAAPPRRSRSRPRSTSRPKRSCCSPARTKQKETWLPKLASPAKPSARCAVPAKGRGACGALRASGSRSSLRAASSPASKRPVADGAAASVADRRGRHRRPNEIKGGRCRPCRWPALACKHAKPRDD